MSPNVVEMGSAAFYTCYKLKTIEIPKVLKAIPDNCFNSTRIKEVVIPSTVSSVGDMAFSWNDSIKTITIEDSDEPISFNDYSFPTFDNGGARYTVYSGRNIERMFRPSESPFPQATTITWGSMVTAVGDGEGRSPFLNNSDTDELLISMSPNVVEMGSAAFYTCYKLKTIVLPKVLMAIPDNCFNSTRIQDVVIPASVMSVGDQAFSWNDSIKTIRIEDSDMSISFNDYSYPTFDNGDANYTVYQGRNIERTFRPSESPFPQAVSVAFGAQVTELGSGMYNCVNIKNIIAPWETPISINSNVFNYDLYGTATLSVPHKLVDTYRAALVWRDFLKIEEMEEVKCFTPTATLEDGRLHFECETNDVTFHYGLEDSDKAYYELEISGGGGIIGIKGDVNLDGIVNGTDIQEVINIIVNAD